MSGYSERTTCPRCGVESLERSIDHDDVNGFCLECGYEYHTVSSVLALEEVNDERKTYEMEPLNALRNPLADWKD